MSKKPRSLPEQLTKKYSSALYSYFRVNNLAESFRKFINNPDSFPEFEYGADGSAQSARLRLASLEKDLADDQLNENDITFIDWRIAEAKALLKYWELKQADKVTQRMVSNYLAAQVELYGAVDEDLFAGTLRYIKKIGKQRGGQHLEILNGLEALVGPYNRGRLFEPKAATFRYYQKLMSDAFPELMKMLESIPDSENYTTEEIMDYFDQALKVVGADKLSWKVKRSKAGANIIISKYRNRVIIGGHYKPLSPLRLKQIILHEVGCHVQKTMSAGLDWHYTRFNENDEGLAIVLEQLMEPQFAHKRSLRYLAMSLALGLDGKKRDFREVYEILWRASFVVGNFSTDTAKKKGFYETSRVFRGGLPNIPSAVFIKDKIYLEGNLKVWEALEAKRLSRQEFRDLFVKRSRIKT